MMRAVRRPLLCLALAGLAGWPAPASLAAQARLLRAGDNDTLPAKPATARVAYGTDSLQFGDLRMPTGPGPFPVAIVIHGGCWVSRFASLQNSTAFSDALRDAGIATWNIEYRRADSPGGGWPNTFLDAVAATDRLRDLARTYPLDLTRVVAVGHSAGGHLAMWLSSADKIPAGSPIARRHPLPLVGAVALAGIADLAEFRTYSRFTCGDVVDGLMGGTPEQVPERYAAGSPRQLLPVRVPQVQIVGTEDRVMPAAAREAQRAAAEATGTPFVLRVIEGAGHHELLSPRSAAWPVILDEVRRLLSPAGATRGR
jgi:acetyl esterase/lipase